VDDGQKMSKVLKQNLNLALVQNPILNLKTAQLTLVATGGLTLDMRCGAIKRWLKCRLAALRIRVALDGRKPSALSSDFILVFF
jgi:hypothetical protein